MRLKVWQCIVLGGVLIALGLTLDLGFEHSPYSISEYGGFVYYRTSSTARLWYELRGWLTVPLVLAGIILLEAWRVYRAGHAEPGPIEATSDEPTRRPPVAPLPSPPRLGDDPFREPPRTHIAVVRHDVRPAPAPIVPGDPDDKPKLLT